MRGLQYAAATIAGVFIFSSACAHHSVVLSGATVIDRPGVSAIENGLIVVEGNRIVCVGVGAECTVPAEADVHDFSGHFIAPGLVDAHVHFAQTGWLDGRPDGVEAPDVYPYDETLAALRADPGRWHRAYLCSGVTAVFDVGGADWTVTDSHATDTDRADRAHVRAAGPLITHASDRNRFYLRGKSAQPMFLPMDSDAQIRAHVAHLQKIGADAVKVWFLTPPPGRREELEARLMLIGDLSRAAGLDLIVHATGLREAKSALRAGAAMLVHSVFDAPIDDEFLKLLKHTKAVYAPTLMVSRGWARAMASVVFAAAVEIDDPNHCVDEAIRDRISHPERLTAALGDRLSADEAMARLEAVGASQAIIDANLRAVVAAGGHVVVATDAGNPLTVHGPSIYWEMEAMQKAGMTPNDIMVAATLYGAKVMHMDEQIGSIEAGKIADLVILAEDPREDISHYRALTHVMRNGVLRAQSELRTRQ